MYLKKDGEKVQLNLETTFEVKTFEMILGSFLTCYGETKEKEEALLRHIADLFDTLEDDHDE